MIRPGDLVVLKSGGPRMAVAAVCGRSVQVTWFDGSAVVEAVFPAACLNRVGVVRREWN